LEFSSNKKVIDKWYNIYTIKEEIFIYYVNISGMKTELAEQTLIAIGSFLDIDVAIAQGELAALNYYRTNFLELINENNITGIVWELD
jgi:hypothetical protein